MDAAWRDAERRWRADPTDPNLVAQAYACARRAGVRPPRELLAATPRWARLAGFLAKWRGPLVEADGVSPEKLVAVESDLGELPMALRECHELAGKALANDDGHVFLCELEAPEPRDGYLEVAWFTDDVFHWAIRMGDPDEDPRTFSWHEGVGWDGEAGPRVSELALQVAMLKRLTHPEGLAGVLHHDEHLPWAALPMPTLKWGPDERMHFHGDGDVIAGLFREGEYDRTLHLASRTPSSLEAARRSLEGRCTWNEPIGP